VQRLLPVALVSAIVTALCIVAIDQPLARWLATRETHPDVWNQIISYLEYPLGIEPWKWTGICVLVAASIITLAVPRLRSYAAIFLVITLTHVLARHASLWVKTATGRLRPSQWLKQGGDTFWRDGGFSFPSGHVLLFASIVLPLVVIYPRTRPLLAIVAFAMVARLAVNAHFVSDVTGGFAVVAALTWLSAVVVRRVLPSQILPVSLR
jgi:membrane-associated phospholipid phosphatase